MGGWRDMYKLGGMSPSGPPMAASYKEVTLPEKLSELAGEKSDHNK